MDSYASCDDFPETLSLPNIERENDSPPNSFLKPGPFHHQLTPYRFRLGRRDTKNQLSEISSSPYKIRVSRIVSPGKVGRFLEDGIHTENRQRLWRSMEFQAAEVLRGSRVPRGSIPMQGDAWIYEGAGDEASRDIQRVLECNLPVDTTFERVTGTAGCLDAAASAAADASTSTQLELPNGEDNKAKDRLLVLPGNPFPQSDQIPIWNNSLHYGPQRDCLSVAPRVQWCSISNSREAKSITPRHDYLKTDIPHKFSVHRKRDLRLPEIRPERKGKGSLEQGITQKGSNEIRTIQNLDMSLGKRKLPKINEQTSVERKKYFRRKNSNPSPQNLKPLAAGPITENPNVALQLKTAHNENELQIASHRSDELSERKAETDRKPAKKCRTSQTMQKVTLDSPKRGSIPSLNHGELNDNLNFTVGGRHVSPVPQPLLGFLEDEKVSSLHREGRQHSEDDETALRSSKLGQHNLNVNRDDLPRPSPPPNSPYHREVTLPPIHSGSHCIMCLVEAGYNVRKL